MFKKVDSRKKYSDMEKEVLEFWKDDKTFEKSVEQRSADKQYSFYDGPPFATGTPHYGHIVASTIKDVVPRYWTMKGYRVERKWGWDCHGLPIENIAEKALGITRKKEIEELGVKKFNDACRSKVLGYVEDWKVVIGRLGRWADMENSYKTMDKDFMESVWWVFKRLYDEGLVYESHRSMHICPRCETTLSQSEVSEGYKTVKDLSVITKFKITDQEFLNKHCGGQPTSFIAWTTTPWSIPTTMGLAIGADFDYLVVKIEGDDQVIFVKDRKDYVTSFLDKDQKKWEVVGEIKGKDMEHVAYEHLFGDFYKDHKDVKENKNVYKTHITDYVSVEDGTGMVTINGAYGEIDMKAANQLGLPIVINVRMDGTYTEEMREFAGMNVKPKDDPQKTDVEIIKYLAKNNALFAKEKYEHSYPHCWRCDTPLLNYATSSWFVAVTKIKEKMLELAKDINWSPGYIKEGRWGNWLEGARDWSISRQRYWASVLPIWKCDCGDIKVIGSIKELEELSSQKVEDLHKDVIDPITFSCSKCQGTMKRIPDVLDCWFESGSMPYAQMHYPFENEEKFEKSFPANFIAEGIDQTRAWFYYLHVIATGIKNQIAFQNVVVNGIALAEDGKKMSKRLQNYPDPSLMMEKYGADVMRFYLLSSPIVAAENLNFSEREMSELFRGMFRMIWNTYSFFTMYANIDQWQPRESEISKLKSKNLLDQWIVSELQLLIRDVNKHMEAYELNKAARLFPKFVDNLSNWYIRRSRRRFWKSESDEDKNQAYQTLWYVLVEFSKVIAPFCPFVAEEIFKNLTGKESVHLEDYPVVDESLVDHLLSVQMSMAREIITEGLQMRANAGIKVRQPLQYIHIPGKNAGWVGKPEYISIIKEELNVKEVNFGDPTDKADNELKLDVDVTPELKLEGQMRELVRQIQEARKQAGFEVENRIQINYQGGDEIFDNETLKADIKRETLANEINQGVAEQFDFQTKAKVDGMEIDIWLKKVTE